MANMSIFNNDGFGVTKITQVFEEVDFVPNYLSKYFKEELLDTRNITIESKSTKLSLIGTSEIGSPIDQLTKEKRKLRNFTPVRLAKGSTITAEEISMIRAYGSTSELQAVENRIAEDIIELNTDLDGSMEAMRLGAVQGKFIDPKTNDIIYDWFDEFGLTKPAEINFKLDNDDTDVLKIMKDLRRAIIKECKGGITQKTKIVALVDADFMDKLVSHPQIKQYYLNWQAAKSLQQMNTNIFDEIELGGITWVEYRGTDDDSTITIQQDKAIFFPVGVKRNLITAYTPTPEMMDFINQKARRVYTVLEKDPSNKKSYVKPEIYSYPLVYTTRPLALRSAKAQ